jgi:hypothetical protein
MKTDRPTLHCGPEKAYRSKWLCKNLQKLNISVTSSDKEVEEGDVIDAIAMAEVGFGLTRLECNGGNWFWTD